MIIQPKVRGFICTAAHPAGCHQAVQQQVDYVQQQTPFAGPKNVLVIGGSTGYGLASRIVSTFASGASTIGVSFERPASDKRTASPGWYNTAAFELLAGQAGYYAKSINGDAFSHNIKQQTAELIREQLGQIDLVVYSIAAPRRIDPVSGETFNSVLKPIGQTFTSKTVDPLTGEVKQISLEPAAASEIIATEQVMGGADWALWIDFLLAEKLLAPKAVTVAYSYIGPELTYPIYKDGTIGRAKQHLAQTRKELHGKLASIQGQALISVNKAIVTQASAAIPVVPLYLALLLKVMKQQGLEENCIEQIHRLFKDHLYAPNAPALDENDFIRIDDREMQASVQQQVKALWQQVDSSNINELSDLQTYCDEFYQLFGFGITGIDYEADVNPQVAISSIKEQETCDI